MSLSGSGASTEDRLVKDGAQGKNPIGTIPRTSHIMPQDQNIPCSCRLNSRWNQPKKSGYLLSGELDFS